MPDVQYVSGISTFQGLLDRLNAWLTAMLAATTLVMRLFQNNITWTPGTNMGNLQEANYANYNPIIVSAFNGAWLDSGGNAYAATNVLDFSCDGTGISNNVFGAYLTQTIPGGVRATATATEVSGAVTSITPGNAGSGYQFPPRIVVSGGGGSGAIVTCTVANGVITGYSIVSGGSGYTTNPTVTIDTPQKVVTGANFQGPVRMALSTDACPVVLQVSEELGS